MARRVELELRRPEASGPPLYLQVAQSLADALRAQGLRPGTPLPSVRELAGQLGVTINTVLAGLRELQAQGLVTSQERAGFFAGEAPARTQAPPDVEASLEPGFDLPAHLQPVTSAAGVLMDLSEGFMDPRLAPMQALGRAYQRGLRLRGAELMGSRDPMGLPRLREAFAEHLREGKGLPADPSRVLVLRSALMAVTLVAQALVGAEGGTVAVEEPGNPDVRAALGQAAPVRLRGLPVDGEGLRPEALEALLLETPLSLLVLTPGCHFPTGVRLSPARRTRILELGRRHRFPILELDLEGDFLPDPQPLAALDPGQVLHAGSLSRIFAPGLGVAHLLVPAALAAPLARARQRLDWQGDPVTEWAVSELFLDGEMERQAARVRQAARERLEAVQEALARTLGDRLAWRAGAMALWLEGKGPLAAPGAFLAWVKACQAQGLKLRPGRHYRLDGAEAAATRLGFTAFTPEELRRAVAMMS